MHFRVMQSGHSGAPGASAPDQPPPPLLLCLLVFARICFYAVSALPPAQTRRVWPSCHLQAPRFSPPSAATVDVQTLRFPFF